ncbi:hypothetical protein SLE2022_259470 [Rubroshorea leprosula]
MTVNRSFVRVDTLEIRALIIRKIGHQRAEKYFDQLRRLFSLKISKNEFDKSCIRTIGRENVPLHNQLIRSIIKNACNSKIPPLKTPRRVGSNVNVNGYQRNCLQSLYGDGFPSSPRRGRSPVSRDRRFHDRISPLGPLGKPQNVACAESVSKVQEQQSPTELLSLGSRPPVEVASVEDGEEVEQAAASPCVQSRSPVTAPLGISTNFGGARKALSNILTCNNYHSESCQSSGELPDTRSLRSRLELKLEMEGINVSLDCVNLLNNGLDAYLKRLIEPCVGLAASTSGSEHLKQTNSQFNPSLNGVLPQSYFQRSRKSFYASMLDFRVAMELNPHLPGHDWSTQLEKICLRASEE